MPPKTVGRACYFCGRSGNPVALEEPSEARLGKDIFPDGIFRLVTCRGCRALYVDSDVTEEHLASLYAGETIATTSETGYDHEALVVNRLPEFRRVWRLMVSRRPPGHHERLLDLGCQTGEFGALAIADGVIPDGIEISDEYAELTRATWGPASNIYRSVGDVRVTNRRYGYVTAFETLEHMLTPIKTLAELGAVVADDGLLALSVPSSDYFRIKIKATSALNRFSPRKVVGSERIPQLHVYTPSGRACELAVEAAGFRAIYITATGWHGRLRHLNVIADALARMTRGRVLLAPSILMLAVPVKMAEGG